jgi:hypothetical protein
MEEKKILSMRTQEWRFEMAESSLRAIDRVTKKAVMSWFSGKWSDALFS